VAGLSVREAAGRVADATKRLLEDVVVDAVQMFLRDVLDSVVLAVALRWDEVLVRLAERGLQPTTENVLSVLEEMHDRVDFDRALGQADDPVLRPVVSTINVVAGLVRRFAPRDLVSKFTYENVLVQARRRGLRDVEEYLTKYPNLCRRLVDWLRSRVEAGGG
jgi:hypothetical protein